MLRGVRSVTPGYAGGDYPDPTYEAVSSGRTGHAEVTRIEYDPSQVSFKTLMTVFFATHDPTTLNRQGNDVGTQYRSIILYENEDQKKIVRDFIHDINNSSEFGKPVVTEIKPLEKPARTTDGVQSGGFYKAEDYHVNYFKNHPENPYCEIVINPKLEKVQRKFAELLNITPA